MIPYVVIGIGLILLVVYFFMKKGSEPVKIEEAQTKLEKKDEKVQKVNYGEVQILFASQTGTAAKLSEQLAEEGVQFGF